MLKLFAVVILTFSISACAPPGDNTSQVKISDLLGLWNSSESKGTKTDLIYTRITSDGSIIEYDFDGDEVDQGLHCYQINSGSVIHSSANHFVVKVDMHANKQLMVELELLDAGNALKIYFIDTHDSDGDGDRAETIKSQIWTRESDTAILDKEPSCKG